jgi:ABC-type thiamin/hydroxymethylpyrimidine transport system permease subunit
VSYLMPHLQALFDIPASTLTLIAMMCSAAMYFIRQHLVVSWMVLILGPLSFTLSAFVNYVLNYLEIFPVAKTEEWLMCTIFSATVGIVGALLTGVGIGRLIERSQADPSRYHRA